MGLGGGADSGYLVVNQEELLEAHKKYLDCAQRMTTLRDELKKAVEGLRGGWKSEGGDAFFEKFDDQWLTNFDDYIAVINHMGELLKSAEGSYRPLFTEAERLKL